MIERNLFYYRIFIIIFWIEACFGFVSEELLPFEALVKLKSPLFFLFDIIIVLLGLACMERKKDKVLLGSFVLIAVVSTILINKESWIALINGSRQFIGVIFWVPIFRYLLTCKRGVEFREKIDRNLFVFLCLQAFCITEQFIRYGANDHGGGSLGNGYSGVISTLICLLSFYFISKKWDSSNYIESLKKNWLYIFLLYPVFLNETKASFLYLAVYFLLLYKFEIKTVGKLLIAAPLIVAGVVGLYNIYLVATNQQDVDVASEDTMTEYLLSTDVDELVNISQAVQDDGLETDNIWGVDLPRFAKIGLLPTVMANSNGGMLLGAGLGQFKGGTTLELTKYATENQWYISGTIPLIQFIVVQLGVIGFIWFCLCILNIISFKDKTSGFATQKKLFLLAVVMLSFVYNDMFQFGILTAIYCYIGVESSLPEIDANLCKNG
jgi:hypothetical protein